MRTPEELVSTVSQHNCGNPPASLLDWLRTAGSLGLAVRLMDAGPRFTGAIRAGVILIPDHADDDDACSVIAHEILEHILVAERHDLAIRAEAMLRGTHQPVATDLARCDPDDQLDDITAPQRRPAQQAPLRRRAHQGLPRLLPRRRPAR